MTQSVSAGFIPRSIGVQDCSDRPIEGAPSVIYSYIAKPDNDDLVDVTLELEVPPCVPYYHSTAQIDSLQVNTSIIGAASITLGGVITAPTFRGNINVQSWKGFDIEHPNKEGHRLRHICVEGPEAAVYIRGKCKDTNIINLPEYWNGLVDLDELSVNLTPFGSPQNLYVEDVKWGKQVIIKNADSGPVNCYYQIWAPRLGNLVVEYKGESAEDYPENQDDHSICGYHYDRRDS